MKLNTLIMGVLSLSFITFSCKKDPKEVQTTNQDSIIENIESPAAKYENLNLTFSAASDSKLEGTVNFISEADKVTMVVNVKGITPGEHAIHIHEFGDCSAPDATSAGGHWNPSGHAHGKWDGEAFHMGDIGNLVANEEGVATLEFSTDKWCLGCDDEQKNLIGKSVIVHVSADDFETQPTGNAGGRIGCVVIE